MNTTVDVCFRFSICWNQNFQWTMNTAVYMCFRFRYAGVRMRVHQERSEHHDEKRSGCGAGRTYVLDVRICPQLRERTMYNAIYGMRQLLRRPHREWSSNGSNQRCLPLPVVFCHDCYYHRLWCHGWEVCSPIPQKIKFCQKIFDRFLPKSELTNSTRYKDYISQTHHIYFSC